MLLPEMEMKKSLIALFLGTAIFARLKVNF